MITEHALLPVDPDRADEFEAAFDEARAIIASSPGFDALELLRSIESPGTYLLLVRWESVEAHTDGFRGSAGYQRWKDLLHRFYDPFPTVEHFAPITQA
ncbi:antibiotic biosynthesis monooxygenase family protein [Williamsia sp. SKLECPSW1]